MKKISGEGNFFFLWLALALVSGVSYFWAVSFSPEDPSPAANNAMLIWAFTLLQTIHILKVILKDKAVALYFLPNEKKFALSCKSLKKSLGEIVCSQFSIYVCDQPRQCDCTFGGNRCRALHFEEKEIFLKIDASSHTCGGYFDSLSVLLFFNFVEKNSLENQAHIFLPPPRRTLLPCFCPRCGLHSPTGRLIPHSHDF